MFNLGAQQTPPKVDRVPHIPMLKEDNVRKGFFEHDDFLALRDALPSYLKGFVAMTERYSHLAKDNLKNAVKRFEDRLQADTQKKIIDLKPDKR
jgi:hypothetical protein